MDVISGLHTHRAETAVVPHGADGILIEHYVGSRNAAGDGERRDLRHGPQGELQFGFLAFTDIDLLFGRVQKSVFGDADGIAFDVQAGDAQFALLRLAALLFAVEPHADAILLGDHHERAHVAVRFQEGGQRGGFSNGDGDGAAVLTFAECQLVISRGEAVQFQAGCTAFARRRAVDAHFDGPESGLHIGVAPETGDGDRHRFFGRNENRPPARRPSRS